MCLPGAYAACCRPAACLCQPRGFCAALPCMSQAQCPVHMKLQGAYWAQQMRGPQLSAGLRLRLRDMCGCLAGWRCLHAAPDSHAPLVQPAAPCCVSVSACARATAGLIH